MITHHTKHYIQSHDGREFEITLLDTFSEDECIFIEKTIEGSADETQQISLTRKEFKVIKELMELS